ncbi:MAG: hypothetical protein ACKON9_15840 [Planctomycetaceae bacterium]
MLCVPAAGFLRVTTAAAGGKPGLRADCLPLKPLSSADVYPG